MKPLTFSLEDFKLKDFIEETLREGKAFIGLPVFIVYVEEMKEFDFDPIFEDYEETNADELYDDFIPGKYLYASFSDDGINYPDVACIDGNVYQTIEKSEEEEYFDDGAPEDFVYTEKLFLGEMSNIGYLLQIQNNKLTIYSAQFYLDARGIMGPVETYSSIEIREDVEVFDRPMQEYLKRFFY